MAYFDIFDRHDPPFDRKLASKYILIIKGGSKSTLVTDDAKIKLFKLMKKIVVKNVKNYSSLARNSAVTENCYEEEEMYSEAFLVMMKCIEKFKVSKKNCFYFYFNKSLSRTFYRMFYKEVRKAEIHKDFGFIARVSVNSSNMDYDVLSVTIESLRLNDFDKKVLSSKILQQKKDDFIEMNDDATVSKYYSSLKNIREKIKKLIQNGEL